MILSFPLVALSMSATNWAMFSVWKLFGGYAVGKSHLVLATATLHSAAPTNATTGLASIGKRLRIIAGLLASRLSRKEKQVVLLQRHAASCGITSRGSWTAHCKCYKINIECQ